MRYLAVDYGVRRLGLALCDADEIFAAPHGVLTRQNPKRDCETLLQTARGLGAEGIVFGLPRSTSGGKGESEEGARQFGAYFQKFLREQNSPLEIEWWDERFSTREALNQMKSLGISQKRGREDFGSQSTDARAAAVILQGFLDHRRQRNSAEETPHRVLDIADVTPAKAPQNEIKDLF